MEALRMNEKLVLIDGVIYTQGDWTQKPANLLDKLAANKKAIFGIVGAIAGFLSFMSLAVPEVTAMFPLTSKIVLAAVSFAGFGAAHVSKPDTVTPVPGPTVNISNNPGNVLGDITHQVTS
jgi:hypothetical protein